MLEVDKNNSHKKLVNALWVDRVSSKKSIGKSATMSPQVIKTHVQPPHHVGILVPVPMSYYTKVFYHVFLSECHLEHN